MGNDSPLAVLSNKNKTLYHYFKQLFAQVTNPPIDPIREELVMSLVSFIGPKPNLLGIDEMNPPLRLEVSQPVLDFYEMEKIRHIERYTGGKFKTLRARHHLSGRLGQGGDRGAARVAVRAGRGRGARGLLHPHHLRPQAWTASASRSRRCSRSRRSTSTWSRKGLRTSTGLVVETGSAREVHHFALLGGYGAEAVHPYLALETLLDAERALPSELDGKKAIKNYVKAIGKGLKKVMSKMGVSTYMSYTGAQLFEAVGLAQALVDKYFTGTASNVERHRRVRGGRGGDPHPPRGVRRADPVLAERARRRRRVRLARARRGAHVDAGRDRQAAASTRARTPTRPTRNTRSSSTTSRGGT